jgi:hypothetical protein
MKLKSWRDAHLGVDTHSDIETDFVASPPPYAKKAKPLKSAGFLDDLVITAKDLYAETIKNVFKP